MAARRVEVPPTEYDGFLHWYTEWFDPTEDRCSFCLMLIPEDEVPLILFRRREGSTWQARICPGACTEVVARRMLPSTVPAVKVTKA